MFGVQLYKNNARALLSRILSILNLDWLQHARSVRGVYEYCLTNKIQFTVNQLNQPYVHVNQPYATFMHMYALCEVFGVQLYKNNASALLLHILSIVNSGWLQHTRSVHGVHHVMNLTRLELMITIITPELRPDQAYQSIILVNSPTRNSYCPSFSILS